MLAVIRSKGAELPSYEGLTDLFCLGTDFDGFIDPLNSYPTVMKFEQLGEDLIKVINTDPDSRRLMRNMKAENFVEKFCFSNAYNFVLKNFK
jgi:microsomal dipeptidase-like Zn-dependent dipeptidase